MSNYPLNLLKTALAANGDKTIPPQTAIDAGLGRFSQEEGWKEINSTPDTDGGIPPYREDFNGVANLLSQFILWYQQGGIMKWTADITYEVGNEILSNGVKYRCIQQCTNVIPPNKSYWKNLDANIPNGMYAFFKIAGIQDKHPIFVGESAPDTSWVLADGTNGTEDLRNKFIYGGDSASTPTGGADSVKLAVANLPAHSHSVTVSTNGAHTHTRGSMNIQGSVTNTDPAEPWGTADQYSASGALAFEVGSYAYGGGGDEIQGGGGYRLTFDASRSGAWTGETSQNGSHSHTVTINNTGSGQAFSILPPYIKKAWFMKIAE